MDVLLLALSMGFASGISPGPLMTLVLTSTLERGFRAGFLTSLAPLLSDAPIVVLSFLVLRRLPETFVTGLTIAGGLLVVWIGIQTARAAGREKDVDEEGVASQRDLLRAAVVNFLNPHPWLFWATVGAPLLTQTWSEAPWQAIAFLVIFYGFLVGSKVAVAWATARGSRFLGSRGYQLVLAGCGLLLVALGTALIWQGVSDLQSLG